MIRPAPKQPIQTNLDAFLVKNPAKKLKKLSTKTLTKKNNLLNKMSNNNKPTKLKKIIRKSQGELIKVKRCENTKRKNIVSASKFKQNKGFFSLA